MPITRAIRPTLLAAVAIGLFAAGAYAQARFPNIDAAQASLASALQSLDRAPDRFGGHKAAAMSLVRQAQQELTLAIQAAH
jgi:hypothetical protein